YLVTKFIYTSYINDPLRHIPGPKINAISRIPYVRHLIKGTTVDNVVDLHRRYGSVVRLTPNEVSFSSGETAWPDIYGFRTGRLKGRANTQKDPMWYPSPVNGVPSILLDNDENHSKGRRLLSHAFSDKALQEQEPLIQKYVDQLVDRLKEVTSKDDQPVDMTKWYNWMTFDVVADLLFGEPFGCLQNLATHKHIDLLFKSLKGFRFMYIVGYFPIVKYLGSLIVDQKMIEGRKDYMNWVSDQVSKRLAKETDRPDFMTYITSHNGEKGTTLSKDRLDSNANLILTAGSETTATLLSGATYLLLKNPSKLTLLTHEIRSTWPTYSSITLSAVNNSAPYLIAVLNESLRYFPPVPTGFERRISQPGGEVISGVFIPEGTAVQVSQWAAHHSEENFADPEVFVPERWLDGEDEKYEGDRRGAMQPFSFGPRNCLGKNLALAEMRLIMAKLLWTFDLELDPKSQDWIQGCKVFTLWDKPELLVKLTQVDRG
ncbi:benzoate 4-monooxygenase cytochrome P450, partial [Sphaerulina musiva SO2202]